MAKKIQDKDWLYNFARPYVDFMFRHSYRRIQYVGKEKLPTDGVIIFAPNHTNALQDALSILTIDGRPKVFMARADIFKKNAKILTWLKIMPIMRLRDGYSNLSQNDELMNKAVDVLVDNVPFCILPEGTHRAKHSLLPLGKGIFRIAWRANERLEGKKPVYIVPVGIEYGNYFRWRSSLLINIGDAINVTQYIADNKDKEQPEIFVALRDKLVLAMRNLFWWIPDDEKYEGTLEYGYLANTKRQSLYERMLADKKSVETIGAMCESENENTLSLLDRFANFHQLRQNAKIGVDSIQNKHLKTSIALLILGLILCAPYFLVCALATSLAWGVIQQKMGGVKDPAFRNSFKCVLSVIFVPISLLIFDILALIFLPYCWAFAWIIATLPSYFFLHDYLRWYRLLKSHIRLATNKSLRTELKELNVLISNTNDK